MAWRLMHASGRKYLYQYFSGATPATLSLETICPTVADAYCYYIALGRIDGASAMRSVALVNNYDGNFESPIKTSYKQLQDRLGRKISAFEPSSLEAYLLSPLFCPRPALLRRLQPQGSNVSDIRRPLTPKASTIESVGTLQEVPAVEVAPAVATVPAAEPVPTAPLPHVAAAAEDGATAVPHVAAEEMARFEVGDLVNVKGISAPGNPGYRCFGMPSAYVVEDWGGGIYTRCRKL